MITCDFQQCGILTCVDSDKPVQPPFKLRNPKWCLFSSLTVIEYLSSKGSDQTRLVWAFAGRTYHIVGNIMLRLICKQFGPWSPRSWLLIWIQTVSLSESLPEIIFEKVYFEKKSADDNKSMKKKYPTCKELTLNAPNPTKVVCFSHLLKCLRSLCGKQCGPRSEFWVCAVCFYT